MAIALEHPEQSPRQLACFITDRCGYFLSESSVYRILKAYGLVPSPASIVLAAADCFRHPTGRVHELWQTDFTYLKVGIPEGPRPEEVLLFRSTHISRHSQSPGFGF